MNFKAFLPHLAALAIFFLTVFVMFTPEFSGRTLRKGDLLAYKSSIEEARKYGEELGTRMNWTGTSFSGMPTYQMSTIREGNQLGFVAIVSRLFFDGGPGFFLAICVSTYLALLLIGVSPWLSIAAAVGATFATNNLVLWEAGHLTKVATISYLPLIAGGIISAFRKKYVLGSLVFALGMGLAIFANHPQMLYYFGLTLPFYGIAKLIEAIRAGELAGFAKSAGALIIGLGLAVGAGASNILPTAEYAPSTMRGGQVLETPVETAVNLGQDTGKEAKQGSGLEWNYAMQWSNGFKDMIATYAPLAAGGGSGEKIESTSTFGKAMRRIGYNVRGEFVAPTYHGSLPFTEGPIYLGAVVWALFIFGLFTARRALAAWLGFGTLLILLMSMGSNLEGLNRFLYENLPLLNKFRTPNSALSVCVILMTTLGIVGLHDWFRSLERDPEVARKQLKISGVSSAVLGLLIALVLPSMLDLSGTRDVEGMQRFTGGQLPDVTPLVDAMLEQRYEMFVGDGWRSLLFVGLTFGTLFLMFRKTFSPLVGGLVLATLFAVDFNAINNRYVGPEDWSREYKEFKAAVPNAADKAILADDDIHFRVYNVTGNPFTDSRTSFFHKSVGGYSAIKMRRYQDLIDGYLLKNDQDVINMLNTKYFIINGENGEQTTQRNPNAFGPAWLVDDIETVSTNDAEFAGLGTVEDLRRTAIVHEDFSEEVAGLQPNGQGSIQITNYRPDQLAYRFSSPSEQLVVFSEIWYGPDLGWEAYIDGQPAELIRANYLLRALRVPAGDHEITMVFNPQTYRTGVILSYVCSILIILGLVGYGVYAFLQRRKPEHSTTPLDQVAKK